MNTYCFNCMMPTEGKLPCSHCGYEGDTRAASHQLPAGTILSNRYLIGNVIGQGGFGITYIGRDLRLNMRIAIKEYYPSGYANRNALLSPDITIIDKQQMDFIEDGKKKFLYEARALAEFCDEPGVVDVRDYFEANQTAYIIMEYLDGLDLRKYLKHNLFTANQIFNLMEPVMVALEKIHLKKIIHRDISPDNIMMLKNGKMVLMDFGAARFVDYSDQKSVSVVLKSGYAPEEQYRAKGIQGPWTDIYALCATIYKCITGITPDDSLQRGYQDEIKWPSELGIIITEQQEAVLKKGLSIKQENRFQNISEMKQALELSDSMHDLEIDTTQDDVTVYKPHISTEEKETEYKPKEKKDNPSDIHNGKKQENTSQEQENEQNEQVNNILDQKISGKMMLEKISKYTFGLTAKIAAQKKILIFVCIGMIVISAVMFAVHLIGKKVQHTDLPSVPYERTMESDAVSLLKQNNIKGVVNNFTILQEKENEKYQTYAVKCEITLILDGRKEEKKIIVTLIYEVDDGEWVLSSISRIES